MALAFFTPSILQVTCMVLFLFHFKSAAVQYVLQIHSNGPITTGAQATIHASLSMKNDDVAFISDLKSYHFNWIFTPLTLIEKSEQRFNSMITVTGEFSGDFPISVWATETHCWLCQPIAKNFTMLHVTEFIVGNLTIAQIEDNRTFVEQGSSSATDTLTLISFFLHDPSNYFKSASFIYNWDFGNGTQLVTEEPFVYYHYSTVGNCKVHLKVVAEWEQIESPTHERKIVQKTGDFTTELELLDAVKSINVIGSRETRVMENLSLSLHINGSPPLTLCWLIKAECIPLEGEKCHLVVINGSSYSLSHTFRNAGQYCLSVRVENDVNMLQTYHEIKVWPTGIHPAFFALPCITLISVMLGFVIYTTFRSSSQQKDLVEVADFDFSPLSDKNPSPSDSESSCGRICCRSCFLQPPQEYWETVRESHRLLHPLYKPVKTYTV
ncbi:transmembrane protein 130 [Chelonoidis abingdonii]|uniref:transmembrane protein 130 n=1 Tax=Chelonoidis abingdonii TaxID=106734 RepID=UPI0013F1C607|nr:transmembrane protein 130 [Chelonoidis abingdonii]